MDWFVSEIETPRADNGTGTVLINKGQSNFESIPTYHSGIFANKDVRKMGTIVLESKKEIIIIANNNDVIQFYSLQNQELN